LDKKYGDKDQRRWQVVVGRGFGCSVTYQKTFFLSFIFQELGVYIFKSPHT
jgi:hypothetical protein